MTFPENKRTIPVCRLGRAAHFADRTRRSATRHPPPADDLAADAPAGDGKQKGFAMLQISLPIVVGLVIGLTQWVKVKLNISGRAAEIAAFVIGVVSGGAYQLVMFPPAAPADYFGAAVVALLMGLVPSGLYQFGGQMADRIGSASSTTVQQATPVTPPLRFSSIDDGSPKMATKTGSPQ